jgi:hypothetical protein
MGWIRDLDPEKLIPPDPGFKKSSVVEPKLFVSAPAPAPEPAPAPTLALTYLLS